MGNVRKGLALIIANAEYEFQPKLLSCNKDGNDMKLKLESLNFDVLHYSNLARLEMLEAISDSLQVADRYSVFLVYYTGHGVQIDGKNYFVPIDCTYNCIKSVFINSSLIDMDTIVGYMNEYEEKTNILIMDACRSGLSFSRDIGTGLATISAGKGSLIAFASAPNSAALCPAGLDGNGLYTKRLLEYIDCPNIKIEDMFKLVRNDVIKDTCGQQIPWENTSLNNDFYFNIMEQDEINEEIYQAVRNNYCGEMLVALSKHFQYTISDIMRIYQHQKSEKVGGIQFKRETTFEQYILARVLEMGFRFENYRWVFNGNAVLMGDFQHDYTSDIKH